MLYLSKGLVSKKVPFLAIPLFLTPQTRVKKIILMFSSKHYSIERSLPQKFIKIVFFYFFFVINLISSYGKV